MTENDIREAYKGYNKDVNNACNLTKQEETTLCRILSTGNIRIMKPDKGSGIVIVDNNDYISYMNAMLTENTYSEISRNEINIAHKRIDTTLFDMLYQGEVDEHEWRFLQNEFPVISGIFGIPKIHKGLDNLNFRPIVDVMDKLSEIFNSSVLAFLSIPTSSSNDSLHPETALLPQFTGATLVVLAVMMATAAVLITVGNVLVLLAFVVDKRLRTQSNLYLLSLALCDLSVGVVSIPFSIPYELYGIWMLGKTLCKFWMVMDYTACAASVFTIVVISYDRHFSVTKPVAYRAQQQKTCNTMTKIAAVWLLAFIIYGPALIFWDIITGQSQVPNEQCFAEFEFSWHFSVCILTCNFFIPFCSVSYFSIGICWNIKKRAKNKQIKVINNLQQDSEEQVAILSFIKLYKVSLKERLAHSSSSKESVLSKSAQAPSVQKMEKNCSNMNIRSVSSAVCEQKTPPQNSALRLSKDKKIAKSLALLICIFGICQAPYMLFAIINSVSWNDNEYYWTFITVWCVWLNSFINPILYPLCHGSFRRAFYKIFGFK
ncbi:histamine H3 receptor-like [Protopterus annectens]|uniref:histamine H3 receptor-like n=1 Tax=Protopterus annectens TaxID=7888 RepID=UPI001CFB757D|nr:histamine H3 receptor-like [Protopterus annectens]